MEGFLDFAHDLNIGSGNLPGAIKSWHPFQRWVNASADTLQPVETVSDDSRCYMVLSGCMSAMQNHCHIKVSGYLPLV
jgi:hypothetical protein